MWHEEQIQSPLGVITCVVKGRALVALDFEGNEDRLRGHVARRFGHPEILARGSPSDIARRIEAYFKGDLGALADVEVEIAATPFELRVYEELRKIPAGETITYAELGRRAGRPTATRAAGAANAKNPISIVVPCHRVIGADGSLTGYAGGLDRKRWLLTHESNLQRRRAS